MHSRKIVEEFRSLNLEDRLALLRALWSDVEAEAEGRSLTDEEVRFLDERIQQVEDDPRPNRAWEDLRADLLDGR